MDTGYPKTVNNVENDEMNLVRAKNGNLWVFWIGDSTLYAQRSFNEGHSWSSAIIIKRRLRTRSGLTDAVAFSVNGDNVIGLSYAEDEAAHFTGFGFLYHRDADPGNVWTDETSQLSLPPGTGANNHLHVITYNQQVFMVVKTSGG